MYKIIKDDKIIDVVEYADFVRFLPAGQAIRTSEELAEGLVGSDYNTIYSLGSVVNLKVNIPTVTIKKISSEEFNRLQSLLNSKQNISADKQALIQAKDVMIASLSDICNNKITAGFSIKLLDGELHNFRLTAEDQINLLNLENQLNAGAKSFIYHSTGMPCKVFVRDDILKIIKAYKKHVLYHTTYFNTAKQYINSLTDVDIIKSFSYGMDITGTVKDPLLRQILIDGGVN